MKRYKVIKIPKVALWWVLDRMNGTPFWRDAKGARKIRTWTTELSASCFASSLNLINK